VIARDNSSEQRTQIQNGSKDAKLLATLWTFAGPSEESAFFLFCFVLFFLVVLKESELFSKSSF
jgi:hypothetical protein